MSSEKKSWKQRITPAVALAGAVGAFGLAAASPAAADTGSYQLTSSTYSISPVSHSATHTGYCADGYHVDGTWSTGRVTGILGRFPATHPVNRILGGSASFNANVTANGDWVSVWSSSGVQQVGTDSQGHPLYQGVSVSLYNASLIHSHDGSFTWTCDPT